jgi:hypothetical protein
MSIFFERIAESGRKFCRMTRVYAPQIYHDIFYSPTLVLSNANDTQMKMDSNAK